MTLDEDGDTWLVTQHSFRYSNDDGPRRFTVQLAETETVQAQRLEVSGLSLEPLYYEETADENGPLVVFAEVEPTGPDAARFTDDGRSTTSGNQRHGLSR